MLKSYITGMTYMQYSINHDANKSHQYVHNICMYVHVYLYIIMYVYTCVSTVWILLETCYCYLLVRLPRSKSTG